MQKQIQVVLLVFFNWFYVNGQIKPLVDNKLMYLSNRNRLDTNFNNSIAGSPYLTTEFSLGTVFSSKGTYSAVLLRYDIYNDRMEFQQDGGIYVLEPKQEIEKVQLLDRIFVVEEFNYKGKDVSGFLELLDSGKITFYVKMVVSFTEKKEPAPMQYEGVPAKFSRLKDIYYYKIGTNKPVKFSSVEKMIESIPDKKEEMIAFIKNKRFRNSKELDEITETIEYYNSL